ncbi:MAG: AraC family transcriptional regulator [Kiritimatiellae bacterium]|nr:AraC family transcriptional regulator [Kiritimatiellia bacterium]
MSQIKPLSAEFEKIVVGGRQSFFWSHAAGRLLKPYHYHPEYEIIYFPEGSGRRLVGTSIANFRVGDLVLIGPNVPHVWMSAPDCTRCETIVVQFLPDFLGSGFFDRPEMLAVRELLQLSLRGVVFSAAVRRDVIARLENFDALNETDRLLSLLSVLVRMSRDAAAHPLASGLPRTRLSRGHEQRIDKVFQHLNKHLTEPISQGQLARSIGMSPATFSRLFKRTAGKCFMAVVNEMRIGEACRRLAEGDQTIAEIAFGCGYETLSHFNRQFRRFTKTTPRQYRRRATGAADAGDHLQPGTRRHGTQMTAYVSRKSNSI